MRLTILIILLLLSPFSGKCQSMNVADSIEVVKRLLKTNGAVESFYLGPYAKPSKQCLRFLFLAKRLTTEEIRSFLFDSSSCLKLYAYSYLRSTSNRSLKKVKKELQTDSSHIYFMSDCVGGNIEVRYSLKRIKRWEVTGQFNNWMKYYDDQSDKWDSFLLTE